MYFKVKLRYYLIWAIVIIIIIIGLRFSNKIFEKNREIKIQEAIENMETNPILLDDGCYEVCE